MKVEIVEKNEHPSKSMEDTDMPITMLPKRNPGTSSQHTVTHTVSDSSDAEMSSEPENPNSDLDGYNSEESGRMKISKEIKEKRTPAKNASENESNENCQ